MTAYFAVFIFCRGFRYIFLFFHIGFIEVDTMKKMILCCMVAVLSMTMLTSIHADEKTKQTTKNDPQIAQNAKSAYLMEYTSGKVIYAKNEKAKLYPASMTKMMGLLLIFESLHDGKLDWKDEVTTSAYAASMGGSQVFLEENETMSVRDMIKSTLISRSVFTILLSLSFCSVTIFIVCRVTSSSPGCREELYESSCICIKDSGVLSSCAAFAVNCLCISNASERRSSILLYETLSWFSSLTLFSSIRESARFCACTSSILSENSLIGFSACPLIKYVATPPSRASKAEIIRLFFL